MCNSFYDQVHTTGMDIAHTVNALAVITLGKDMTFRDYAQGAFRMRGIGKGQRMEVFVIPEIRKLVWTQLRAAKLAGKAAILKQLMPDGSIATMPLVIDQGPVSMDPSSGSSSEEVVAPRTPSTLAVSSSPAPGDLAQVLRDLSSWLLIQTCLSESVQFNMLTEQHVCNVWRKVCFKSLVESYTEIGAERCSESLHSSLEVFRERLDYQVEDRIPVNVAFLSKLRQLVKRNQEHLQAAGDQATIKHVLNLLTQSQVTIPAEEAALLSPGGTSTAMKAAIAADPTLALQDVLEIDAHKSNAFNAEQQQEQEQEQEQYEHTTTRARLAVASSQVILCPHVELGFSLSLCRCLPMQRARARAGPTREPKTHAGETPMSA
jgi:hypothetical protein